jgi:signal transduction histidine kinase
LSEEDQKKLFGKFTRLTARPTGGESSTGLGLSIVKRLAEAMKGTVTCSSMLGHGATFSLRLPAWPKEESAPLTVVPAAKGAPISFAEIKAQAQGRRLG